MSQQHQDTLDSLRHTLEAAADLQRALETTSNDDHDPQVVAIRLDQTLERLTAAHRACERAVKPYL